MQQFHKRNENYYLSDDTVIVADGRRSSVKSYDWRCSTSKTQLFRWLLAQQVSYLHVEEKVTTQCKLPCIDKGINNASRKHAGSNNKLFILFELQQPSNFYSEQSIYPPKHHGVESMESCDTNVHILTMITFL